MIIIGTVYYQENDVSAWIQAKIVKDKISDNVRYEVDKKYKNGLCAERSDAFVVAMIGHAIDSGEDISFETPLSGELFHSLTQIILPMFLHKNESQPYPRLIGPLDFTHLPQGTAVAAPVSGGIDSFYTLLSHRDDPTLEKLTHGAIFDVGAYGDTKDPGIRGGDSVARRRRMESENSTAIAKTLGLPLVHVRSNISVHFFRAHGLNFHFANAGAVLALGKFWKTYYIPSSASFRINLPFNALGTEPIDDFEWGILPALSTATCRMTVDGPQRSRVGKMDSMIGNPIVRDHLMTCWASEDHEGHLRHCGKCGKCVRGSIISLMLGEPAESFYLPIFNSSGKFSKANRRQLFRKTIRNQLKGRLYLDDWPELGGWLIRQLTFGDHFALLPHYLRHWRRLPRLFLYAGSYPGSASESNNHPSNPPILSENVTVKI